MRRVHYRQQESTAQTCHSCCVRAAAVVEGCDTRLQPVGKTVMQGLVVKLAVGEKECSL